MNQEKSNFGSLLLALLPVGIFLLALIVAFDPQQHEEMAIPGVIVGNIQQVGDIQNPEDSVQVRLNNNIVVNALITPTSEFPYKIGTPVRVTQYRSMIFSKRSYRATTSGALTTQSRGPPWKH